MSQLKMRVKLPSGIKIINLENVVVRKADERDIEGVFHVAASVGKKEQDPMQGFLMDDYGADPEDSKNKLKKSLEISDYFYVAEYIEDDYSSILGFTFGLPKDVWLRENPKWVEDCYFRPDFDKKHLDNFIVLEKIAVLDRFKRQGIGGMLSKRLIKDIKEDGIYDIFEEVIISPVPNLPSVLFKAKRQFMLAGVRYEWHENRVMTTLIYHRRLRKNK
ncbi:MAG: GNAT family N-acetyltransferase [Bacillota bacterium]